MLTLDIPNNCTKKPMTVATQVATVIGTFTYHHDKTTMVSIFSLNRYAVSSPMV